MPKRREGCTTGPVVQEPFHIMFAPRSAVKKSLKNHAGSLTPARGRLDTESDVTQKARRPTMHSTVRHSCPWLANLHKLPYLDFSVRSMGREDSMVRPRHMYGAKYIPRSLHSLSNCSQCRFVFHARSLKALRQRRKFMHKRLRLLSAEQYLETPGKCPTWLAKN